MLSTKCAFNAIFGAFARKNSEYASIRIAVTCGGRGGANAPPPPILFLPKNIFVALELKRGKYKNWGEGGKGGECILRSGSNQSSPTF